MFKVEGKKDLYIAVADRWLPTNMDWEYEEYKKIYEKMFDSEYDWKDEISEFEKKYGTDRDFNTSLSDYVWLPFRFDGEMGYLDWLDEWRVEDYE